MSGVTRLLGSLRPHPGRVVAAISAGAATVASSIGLLTTSAYLISRAALHPPILDLTIAIVGVRFFGIARAVFRYLERLASHDLSLRLLTDLRMRTADALRRLGPAGIASFRAGDLVGRVIDDVDETQHVFVRIVYPPLVAAVVAVLTGILAVAWLPAAAPMILAPLLLALIVVPWLTHRAGEAAGRVTAAARGRLVGETVEVIEGAEAVVALGAEEHLTSTAFSTAEQVAAGERRTAWLHGFGEAAVLALTGTALVGTLWVAAAAASSGTLDGVMVAVLAMLAVTPFEAAAPLPPAFERLGRSLGSTNRLFEIIDADPPVAEPVVATPMPDTGTIAVVGATAYGRDGTRILGPIDLTVRPGSRLGIIGETGSGKTTLAHLIGRFRDPDDGEVSFADVDLRRLPTREVRLRVGYEDDRAFLFSGSVLGNVRLGDPDAAPEAVADVLERVGLGAWLERLPGGLETDVGESGRKVSGGQRRRLALARALLADFPILVLDEPISGLDPATARDVMDDLLAATVGRTLVLITHHALGLDRMDENVVVEDGRIVDRGAHDDLLERSARYRRMWDVTRSGTGDTRPK